jgi:hypothetical protein
MGKVSNHKVDQDAEFPKYLYLTNMYDYFDQFDFGWDVPESCDITTMPSRSMYPDKRIKPLPNGV